MNEYKKKLEIFLEHHAKERDKSELKVIKKYEEHLMIGALLFAMNAGIITPIEELDLDRRYVGNKQESYAAGD